MHEKETTPPIVEQIRSFVKSSNIGELKRKCLYQPFPEVVCTLPARIILEEARRLGGNGRLYDVDLFDAGTPHATGHTYVVLEGMKDSERALNIMGSGYERLLTR